MEPLQKDSQVELTVPSNWTRILALFIDQLVFLPVFILIWLPALKAVLDPQATEIVFRWPTILIGVLVTLLLQAGCLVIWGATPGKYLLSLRVINSNSFEVAKSSHISWMKAFLRVISWFISSFLLPYIVLAVSFFRKDRRHLVDLMVGTRVIQLKPRNGKSAIRKVVGSLFMFFGIITLVANAFRLLQMAQENQFSSYTQEGIVIKLPRPLQK